MSNDALMHYGVLGMKWGVRRYQPYPKGTHGTFLGQSRDEDIRIKKGTETYRVQATKDLKSGGQAYIAISKLDHVKYLTAAASGGALYIDGTGNGNDGRSYSLRMKIDKDIVAPSYQKTMDSFIKTVDTIGVKNVAKEVNLGKDFIKNYKKMKVDELRDNAYCSFVKSFMRDSKAKDMFFNDLKEQGYNAIVDENDKRFGKSDYDSPLIVFDRSMLKTTKSKAISKMDHDYFSEIWWGGQPDSPRYSKTRKEWDNFAGSNSYRS